MQIPADTFDFAALIRFEYDNAFFLDTGDGFAWLQKSDVAGMERAPERGRPVAFTIPAELAVQKGLV